jgi:copper chaperone CopZ
MTRSTFLLMITFTCLASAGCANRADARIDGSTSTTQAVFQISGMNCDSCEHQIEETVRRLEGIINVRATIEEARVVVELDPSRVSAEAIEASIERLGFEAVLGSGDARPELASQHSSF